MPDGDAGLRRLALLVIHGIGDQKPYETMDRVAARIHGWLAHQGITARLTHVQILRRDGSASWQESIIRIALTWDTGTTRQPLEIDVHEYYWAYKKADYRTSTTEIADWIKRLGLNIGELRRTMKDSPAWPAGPQGVVYRAAGYTPGAPGAALPRQASYRDALLDKVRLSFLLPFTGIRWHLPRSVVLFLVLLLSMRPAWLRWLSLSLVPAIWGAVFANSLPFLKGRTLGFAIDRLRDVVVYTASDPNHPGARFRQRILSDGVALLAGLLARPNGQANPAVERAGPYDGVLIISHSMGTVVGNDALNRLIRQAAHDSSVALDRLYGFVTMGSPLDKLRVYFADDVGEQVAAQGSRTALRDQITRQLYGFRVQTPMPTARGGAVIGDALTPLPALHPEFRWLNFYAEEDPISDALDFFRVDGNYLIDATRYGPGGAHDIYWEDPHVFAIILGEMNAAGFFVPPPAAAAAPAQPPAPAAGG
ncbi:MAG: hypothetical protein OHK0024_27920 [Thalassobaculales bacterium]